MRIYLSLVVLFVGQASKGYQYDNSALNGWAISSEMLDFILQTVEPGETILELGSGSGTGELAKFYTVYSIEHEREWMYKYNTNYIYAPIKNYGRYRWYNMDCLKNLPTEYSLILIDGPPGPSIGRYGFYHHLHLFNVNVPIIFDDIHRKPELDLLKDVAKKLNRPFTKHKCSDGKIFGVIMPLNN